MKKLHVFLPCLLIGLTVLLSACKKWDPWEEGGGGNPGNLCPLSGTMIRVPCGISDLDNLWIRGYDGKYYQPCDASILHTMDLGFVHEGAAVRFGYSELKGASVCGNEHLVRCPYKLPERTRIRLTCIQPLVFRTGE